MISAMHFIGILSTNIKQTKGTFGGQTERMKKKFFVENI